MNTNNPLDLAHLRALHEAAAKGLNWQEEAIFNAACKEHLPTLLDRLEAAERERDALRNAVDYYYQQFAWIEQNGDTYTKDALLDFIRRTIGDAQWEKKLAARDARMKALGAAEWLEDFCADLAPHDPTGAFRKAMTIEAARLRREAGNV